MQMKMKYGPEAHVYEHKVLTEGGLFGTGLLASKMYEITVAIPEKSSSKERVEKKIQDLRELLQRKSLTPSSSAQGSPAMANAGSRLTGRSNSEQPRLHVTPKRTVGGTAVVRDLPAFSDWVNQDGLECLEEDLPSIEDGLGGSDSSESSLNEWNEKGLSFVQEMIARDSATAPATPNLTLPAFAKTPQTVQTNTQPNTSLTKLREKLLREGISADYLDGFLPEVEAHLSSVDKGRWSAVLEKSAELLESRIAVDADLFRGTKKGKRKVVFIVGPTGSGKTTTVAKLAAKYFLHQGKTVSLYTTDNYRIAAVEQLKRYADTMDLPFLAVKDIKKFREALLRDGSELVLVDTAGYSHKDRATLLKMKEYYTAMGENDQWESILVLPAVVSAHNASEVLKAYEELGYQRVILSKLDESDYLGSFIELADTHSKEFAYLSVGQDVPFDILGADKKLLAECVIYPEKMKGMKGEIFSKKG